jgi:hypothetical protein
MKGYIRLIDLENVSKQNVDIKQILVSSYGYKDKGFFKKIRMKKLLKKVYADLNKVRQCDISKVEFVECDIKKPMAIDFIPYCAMMRLVNLMTKKENVDLSDLVADIIATVCFKEHYPKHDFKESDYRYKWFKQRILNSPLIEIQ